MDSHTRERARPTRWWVLGIGLPIAALALALGSSNGAAEVAAVAPEERGPLTLSAASEAVSIEMYSASWCTACSQAKVWLREQNIRYHEIDIDRGGAMGQLALLNPNRTIPTFDVGGHVLVGFRPQELASAIQDAAH